MPGSVRAIDGPVPAVELAFWRMVSERRFASIEMKVPAIANITTKVKKMIVNIKDSPIAGL